RGLVRTAGRGPSWRAKLTQQGHDYLAQVDGTKPPAIRQANRSVTEQLVSDVIAAGGSIRRPRKQWGQRDGVDYSNRAVLAERHGKVPKGKRLQVKPVSGEEVQIALVDIPEE